MKLSAKNLALLLFVITLPLQSLKAAEQIKVGVILPLSGELAIFGNKVRQGIELAAADFAPEIKAIYEDGAFDKNRVLAAFNKLTSVNKVKYIIGPFGPDQTLAAAPLAKQRSVLLISISLCDERFLPYPNVFCTFPSFQEQVTPLTELFSKNRLGRGYSRAAFICEDLQGFEGYSQAVDRFARDNSIELVVNETFLPGTQDFRAMLTKLLPGGVDLLIIGGANPSSVISAFRQAKELGIQSKAKWYLSEHDAALFAKNGELLEGAYTSAIPAITPEFSAAFAARYHAQPDLYQALGHDAAQGLFAALTASGSQADAAMIEAYLLSHPVQNPAAQGFKYDQNRRVATENSVTRIVGGKQARP